LRPKTGQLLFGLLVWRIFIFFSIFSFGQMNYIFHRLNYTSSTSNSNSIWARGKVLFKTSIEFVFPVFLYSHVAKTAQRLNGMVLRKKFVLPTESWFSTFSPFFCSWFYMMSPSMWPLWSKCEVFDFFQEILQGP
jgi:hypothetical protein